jgi:hypothetical protein
MRLSVLLFWSFLALVSVGSAQVEFVSGNFFPAELEFSELQKVASEETFDTPARLSKIADGQLFSDIGFKKYAKRVYSAGGSASLSIEVLTLLDARAAYSAMTILRNNSIQDGPPGDVFTKTENGIRFAQDKQWVRIQGKEIPEDLVKRVAISVSNRIGSRQPKPPSLVSHLPKTGYDPASVRYFPAPKAFEFYCGSRITVPFRPNSDMEIAQANYTLNNYTGLLYLLSFPTSEVAEEYYTGLSVSGIERTGNKTYAKRAGPLVGILTGSFDPGTADKILNGIQYKYSLRWVYEKGEKSKTVWGIPAGILGTVVKSLLFVVLLCAASIVLGIGVALIRVMIRQKRSLDQPDENEMTRLRLP